MSNEPDNTNIQDRYAARLAADLESNEKEREAIHSKIADLQARLEQLDNEHAWLSTMRGTVVGAPAARERAAQSPDGNAEAVLAEPAVQAIPQPRRAKKAASEPRGRRKKAAQAKPAGEAKAPKAAAKKKSEGPPLRELILDLLAQHHQPRMVGEVVNELAEAHPERAASNQVVRNTLEALVAKNYVERERKQGSVFYTARENDAAAAETAPETASEAAAPEAAEEKAAPEAAEEKVAAEV
ncbi:BlaI/MecI/CopY family transcriptional regulator [Streptomyces sp. 7N604]|uniref:BlaI/MecI/CopY family transcriptional regulator n=1 Tax=Streptomyces sp. 7N604 TaxID=3457415 RepID=UPI003FD2C764